jgi:hypothetical protein
MMTKDTRMMMVMVMMMMMMMMMYVCSTAVGKTLGVARFPGLTLISFKVRTHT